MEITMHAIMLLLLFHGSTIAAVAWPDLNDHILAVTCRRNPINALVTWLSPWFIDESPRVWRIFSCCNFLMLFCRFFLDIASDSPPSDSVNHSLSFISDGNVLALHRLLWNNQERIGQYLSSNRSAMMQILRDTRDVNWKIYQFTSIMVVLYMLGTKRRPRNHSFPTHKAYIASYRHSLQSPVNIVSLPHYLIKNCHLSELQLIFN